MPVLTTASPNCQQPGKRNLPSWAMYVLAPAITKKESKLCPEINSSLNSQLQDLAMMVGKPLLKSEQQNTHFVLCLLAAMLKRTEVNLFLLQSENCTVSFFVWLLCNICRKFKAYWHCAVICSARLLFYFLFGFYRCELLRRQHKYAFSYPHEYGSVDIRMTLAS